MRKKLKPVPVVVISNRSTALEDSLVSYFINATKEELEKLEPQEQAIVIRKLCDHFKPVQTHQHEQPV